jgi:hypothetical protein
MLFGVLEQLRITEDSPQRLVLRELPLMAWLFAGAFVLGAINMWILGLYVTAVGALIGLIVILLIARIRLLIFDRTSETFSVVFRSPLRRNVVLEMPLSVITGVSVQVSDDENTQLILHTTQGSMGLSVYSRDLRDWKGALAERITAFLDKVHLDIVL